MSNSSPTRLSCLSRSHRVKRRREASWWSHLPLALIINYIYKLPFFHSHKIKCDILFRKYKKSLQFKFLHCLSLISQNPVSLLWSCDKTHLEHIMFILTCLFIPISLFGVKAKLFWAQKCFSLFHGNGF